MRVCCIRSYKGRAPPGRERRTEGREEVFVFLLLSYSFVFRDKCYYMYRAYTVGLFRRVILRVIFIYFFIVFTNRLRRIYVHLIVLLLLLLYVQDCALCRVFVKNLMSRKRNV
jgi:hypothetical protein